MSSRSDLRKRGRNRVTNACQRCRKQKIKCSGSFPCEICDRRGLRCQFGSGEKMVMISESDLLGLRARLERYEGQHRRTQSDWQPVDESLNPLSLDASPAGDGVAVSSPDSFQHETSLLSDTLATDGERHHVSPAPATTETSVHNAELSNPLVLKQPAYLVDSSGRMLYLGHASTWGFSRHLLNLAHQAPHFTPSFESTVDVDGRVYPVCGTELTTTPRDITGLPSLELSLFYIQSVKFRTQPLFYLFDESEFIDNLYEFYEDFTTFVQEHRIWYVHYLVIVALGRAIVTQRRVGDPIAGIELFNRALRLLPDVTVLRLDLVASTEVLCCIALYLLCIDHLCSSQIYLGQALRMAQLHGLHTDMQESILGQPFVERGRRVWRTVYTLDRRLSTSMGVPNFVHDEDVTIPDPSSSNGDIALMGQVMYVKICQLMGRIISTVYSNNDSFNKAFINTAQQVLRGVAGLADELDNFTRRCLGEVSRVAIQLNLAYHQCLILTSRPCLFHLFKLRLQDPASVHASSLSPSIKGLVQVCIDSAIQITIALSQLRQYDLLDTFLPFDTENAFVAGLVLVISPTIHPRICPSEDWLGSILTTLEHMAQNGNTVAQMRRADLEELARLPNLIKEAQAMGGTLVTTESVPMIPFATPVMDHMSVPSLGDPFFDEWVARDGLSAAQIMDLADALDAQDVLGSLPF